MNFAEIIDRLNINTVGSLPLFSPELCIVGTIVALLLVRLFNADRQLPGSVVAIVGTVAALILAALQFKVFRDGLTLTGPVVGGFVTESKMMFTGLLLYDGT